MWVMCPARSPFSYLLFVDFCLLAGVLFRPAAQLLLSSGCGDQQACMQTCLTVLFHLLSRCCFSVGVHMPAMSVRRIGAFGRGQKPCTSVGVVPLGRWVLASKALEVLSKPTQTLCMCEHPPLSLVAVGARAWLSRALSQCALLCMTELGGGVLGRVAVQQQWRSSLCWIGFFAMFPSL